MRAIALAVLAGTLVLGAAPARADDDDETPTPQAPAPDPSAARRARVYARVGNATITVGTLEDEIAKQPAFRRARFHDAATLKALAEQLLARELLAREATRRGLDRNAEARQAIDQMAVQHLLRSEIDERITPESIPEADVRAYYDGHPEEFSRPEMVRASHILLADQEGARTVLAQARETDMRGFRELARVQSLDTETKLRGGDLRYFARDGQVPGSPDTPVDAAIATAAFGLTNVGDVSDPVAVGERFSLVKLTGRRPAETRTFEQTAQGIRLKIWRERRKASVDAFLARLRERLHPETHPDLLAAIQLASPDPTKVLVDPHR
jgi:peptidyl-prolyl cis-trans isomerase C